MGNGVAHDNQVYGLWQHLGIYYDDWQLFASGGQEFTTYDMGEAPREHPGGKPIVTPSEQERLEDIIRYSTRPVVLIGFSAGANLAMRTAIALKAENCATPLALLALGHGLMIEHRWATQASDLPGIIILGERELDPTPYVDGSGKVWLRAKDVETGEYSGRWYLLPETPNAVAEYKDLSSVLGGIALDELGENCWGDYAGGRGTPHQISRALPRCMVLLAADGTHNVGDYRRALQRGVLRHVSGPQPASSTTCSSSSSSNASTRSLSV